jgi:teichuronic acid biosynthesis glycosyltransferase TuaC
VRIAVVTTSWPRFEGDPCGHFVAADTRALAQRSEAEGRAVEVVVIAAEGAAFGWPGLAARIKESPLRLFGAGAWVARARRQVAEGNFDAVVAHWALPSAWPISMAPGPRLEVVSHGGDVRLLVQLPSAPRAHLVGRIAARAERWRFVSQSLADVLLQAVPSPLAREVSRIAHVAPSAIDLEPPSAAAVAAKRAQIGTPFAVCVARLVRSKRVDLAIAWAGATTRPLVVVGDGPERESLEKIARASGGRVYFAGRTSRPEALEWIAASAVLVQPSRLEGASTVVREAERLGVPVVALEAPTEAGRQIF